MSAKEQIERIRDLVDILSDEANEHAHLREIVEGQEPAVLTAGLPARAATQVLTTPLGGEKKKNADE